jgi:hypothetical protein
MGRNIDEAGAKLATLLSKWEQHHPSVVAIPVSTSVQRGEENEASANMRLIGQRHLELNDFAGIPGNKHYWRR